MIWGVGAGGVVGLVTQNALAAILVALILTGFAFVRPLLVRPARAWFTFALFPLLLFALFASARIYAPAPVPTSGGGYLAQVYDCGTALSHPLQDPISAWAAEDSAEAATGMEHADQRGVVQDCRSGLNAFRIDALVILGVGLIALIITGLVETRRSDEATT